MILIPFLSGLIFYKLINYWNSRNPICEREMIDVLPERHSIRNPWILRHRLLDSKSLIFIQIILDPRCMSIIFSGYLHFLSTFDFWILNLLKVKEFMKEMSNLSMMSISLVPQDFNGYKLLQLNGLTIYSSFHSFSCNSNYYV